MIVYNQQKQFSLPLKTLPCITPIHKGNNSVQDFLNGSLTSLGFQALPRPTIMIYELCNFSIFFSLFFFCFSPLGLVFLGASFASKLECKIGNIRLDKEEENIKSSRYGVPYNHIGTPVHPNEHGLQISDSGKRATTTHFQQLPCAKTFVGIITQLGRYFKFQQPQVSTTKGADADCIKDRECNVRCSKLLGK